MSKGIDPSQTATKPVYVPNEGPARNPGPTDPSKTTARKLTSQGRTSREPAAGT